MNKNGRSPVKRPELWLARFRPSQLAGAATSIRTQLIVWNTAALILLLGVLGVVCRFVTLKVMMDSVDQEMARSVRMFRRPPRNGPPPGMSRPGSQNQPTVANTVSGPESRSPNNKLQSPDEGHRRMPDSDNPLRAHIYDASGKNAFQEDSRATWDIKGLRKALNGETTYTTIVLDDEPVRVLSAPGYDPFGARGAIQIGYSLKEVYRAVGGINVALLLLVPIGFAGAGFAGIVLTRRVLSRVHSMTRAAGAHTGFSHRLPVSGNDEFSELAKTFNELLSGLDAAYQKQAQVLEMQQRFTADASHELKTPLTIIRGTAGMGAARESLDARTRGAFHEIEEAAAGMSTLVQDLLMLAHSDEGRLCDERTELLVSEILESARKATPCPSQIRIRVEQDDLTVNGSETELIRLFRNLMDNGIRYARQGKGCCVTASAVSIKDNVVVTLQDNGCGIAPEHIAHLGERFYRVDSSRTRPTGGTGLGLSICRSVVTAHGGTMRFDSKIGEGTTVTVELPVADYSSTAS